MSSTSTKNQVNNWVQQPQILGDYKLGKIIGHGAYAVVKIAHHIETN
jgi:hypothetical protein